MRTTKFIWEIDYVPTEQNGYARWAWAQTHRELRQIFERARINNNTVVRVRMIRSPFYEEDEGMAHHAWIKAGTLTRQANPKSVPHCKR